MEIADADGDRLEFRITTSGTLRQYCNGRLEIRDIRALRYSAEEGRVQDETGSFHLRAEDRVEEALGLRMLAARCGVTWSGDEPSPATRVILTDTDGDKLEFRLTDAGKVQEFNNGKLELDEVRRLHLDASSGVVRDDSGEFGLPAGCYTQKLAALYSLAQQSGIEWSGDDPVRPLLRAVSEARALDIENCDSAWEFKCPKTWESLSPTDKASERFCETCRETVYFCGTQEELEEHTKHRRCVAFDAGPASGGDEGRGEEKTLLVRVVTLSGQELPEMRVSPAMSVPSLKEALAEACGIPPLEQRLILGHQELPDSRSLAAVAGGASEVELQIVRVPRPEVKRANVRRMMGKRASRR